MLEKINRLNDYLFKRIFGSPENKDILIDLLNAVLMPTGGCPIVAIDLLDRNLDPPFHGDKASRVDILAYATDGRIINVEVQLLNRRDMVRRTLFYWSNLYHSQLAAGQKYDELRPTITINVLGYEAWKQEPRYHHTFELRERSSGRPMTDDLQIHFLEVPKILRAQDPPQHPLQRWLMFFAGIEGDALEEIAMATPMIKKALTCQELYLKSEADRRRYKQRELALKDLLSIEHQARVAKTEGREEGRKEGREEGREEGRKEGREEGRKEGREEGRMATQRTNIRRMRQRGLDTATIADLLGIPHEEVEALS